MHPLLAKPLRIGLLALAWVLAGGLLAVALRVLTPQPLPQALLFAVPLAVLYGFAALSAWWVCRANPLSRARAGRTTLAQLSAAAQLAIAWTAMGGVWGVALEHLLPGALPRVVLLRDLGALLAFGFVGHLLSAVLHYLALAFETSHDTERRLLESQVSAREAELRALRAQLNPHFLFNSLNSINALVGSDPEGARRMCEGLGDFLRRTLALGARADVALGEELELVERYLAIERVRFGERLGVRRDCPAELLRCRVPPLLLQPLVENAVKHGVAALVEGGTIAIAARLAGDDLVLTVENPVDGDAPARPGARLGLANVRRRLDAFGTRGAKLEAESDGEHFRVTLTLPALVRAAGPDDEEDDA